MYIVCMHMAYVCNTYIRHTYYVCMFGTVNRPDIRLKGPGGILVVSN